MTDPPKRPSTMRPPPDRDRKTDPPMATDRAPPDDLLEMAGNVYPRLAAIEEKLKKLDQLHELLMGTPPKEPGGKGSPSIVTELHRIISIMSAIGLNTESVAEQQKTLPKLMAQELANKFAAMFQDDIAALKEADKTLLARIDKLAESAGATGPNGSKHSG